MDLVIGTFLAAALILALTAPLIFEGVKPIKIKVRKD